MMDPRYGHLCAVKFALFRLQESFLSLPTEQIRTLNNLRGETGAVCRKRDGRNVGPNVSDENAIRECCSVPMCIAL